MIHCQSDLPLKIKVLGSLVVPLAINDLLTRLKLEAVLDAPKARKNKKKRLV